MPSTETIEPWLRGILRCPQCKGELTDATGPALAPAGPPELHCGTCSLGYAVEGGIPVLLIDLARPLGD